MEGIIKNVRIKPFVFDADDGVVNGIATIEVDFDAAAMCKLCEENGVDPEDVRTSYNVYTPEGVVTENINLKEAAETGVIPAATTELYVLF